MEQVGRRSERSSVLRAARDYALYGKENLDALTEGSFPGKKYWELGEENVQILRILE